MFRRVLAIIAKEMRELLRDPIYVALSLLVPVTGIYIMGAGINLDVKNIPMAVYDRDRSAVSREYISSFINSDYFRLIGQVDHDTQAEEWMALGKIRLFIEIPENFSEKLAADKPVTVRVAIDGSFPSRAEVITGYVNAIHYQTNNRLLADYMRKSGQTTELPEISPIAIVWYNPTLESKNFIIPGMLAILLLFYPAILGSLVVVREKEIGTIYNLYCSPVKGWEVVLGKAIPYIAISFAAYLLLFLLTVFIFEVKFTGSFFVLSLSALLFLACTVGYGLLLSMLISTQIAAMFITLITTLMPSLYYSGLLAPISGQSMAGKFISVFLPSTYFMEVVRGIYLKGATFAVVYPSLLALVIYLTTLYVLAVISFRKKVS